MECYAKQLGETKVMDKDDEEYIIEKFVQFLNTPEKQVPITCITTVL
jgi:hypothetical protein